MWKRLREMLRQWLLQGYEPVVKAPLAAAPVVMTMEDAGNDNVQKAPSTTGPVHMSMQGVGSGNMQVGSAHGDVINHVNHSTRHVSHITIVQAQAPLTPKLERAVAKPTSAEQSAALRRLDQLRNKVPVLDFMEREFSTRMVIHLNSEQLYRLHKYLDAVMRDPRNARKPRNSCRKIA